MLEVDQHGFDEVDRKLLLTIIENTKVAGRREHAGGRAREEADAIEEIHEPFLIQIGFLNRTPRGVWPHARLRALWITPNRRQSSLF